MPPIRASQPRQHAPCSLERSPTRRVAIVSLHGDHDLATSDDVRLTLLDAQDAPLVVIDFADCTFMDSCVMGVIVGATKRAATQGGRVLGTNLHGIPLKAATVAGLHDTLDLHDTRHVPLSGPTHHLRPAAMRHDDA